MGRHSFLVKKVISSSGLFFFFLFNLGVYFFLQPVYLVPDGVGYVAYLPALFARHTLSFLSIFDAVPMGLPLARTSTGWSANLWPFGLSFLWLPFYEGARIAVHFFYRSIPQEWNPFYLGALNMASMLFGGGAGLLLYDALSSTLSSWKRQVLALLCFFGTPLFYYSFCIGAMAHAASAFASGLFLWYWLKTTSIFFGAPGYKRRWFLLGVLAGIAAMVRTQEIIILIAPLWEWARKVRHHEESFKSKTPLLLLGGVCLGLSPQLLIWRFLYGSYFGSPQIFNLALANFALGKSLFSSFHGLFAWTPLYFLASVGLFLAAKERRWEAQPFIAILFSQILINSFYTAWWDMLSFSLRLLTGTFLIAGVGLGWLVRDKRFSRAGWMGIGLCAGWSLLLALHGYAGTIDLRLFYPWPLLIPAAFDGHALAAGLYQTLWHYGHPPIFLIALAMIFESFFLLWLWTVLHKRSIEENSVRPTRILLWTFLPWLCYALIFIGIAQRAPKPLWPHAVILKPEELGSIFMADAFEGKARYWLARHEPALALAAIEQAEQTLPPPPVADNFREEFKTLRHDILKK